jgi:hypothetical protein
MHVSQIQVINPSFGIYKESHSRINGKDRVYSVLGETKDANITVYSTFENNKLIAKLYYLADKLDNLIKFKLVEFKDGKKIKTLVKARKNPEYITKTFFG